MWPALGRHDNVLENKPVHLRRKKEGATDTTAAMAERKRPVARERRLLRGGLGRGPAVGGKERIQGGLGWDRQSVAQGR